MAPRTIDLSYDLSPATPPFSGNPPVAVSILSVDHPPDESPQILPGNGVLILENLTNLDRIGREAFQLVALPLRLAGRDASPVRAIALVED